MTTEATGTTDAAQARLPGAARRFPILEALALLVIAGALLRPQLTGLFSNGAVRSFITVFVAVCVQALPFLVLGVALSGFLAAFVSPAALARLLPRHAALCVPIAGLAGAALPGCECGSVPVAGRLIARGAPIPAAVTFLLSAPAINPVVLVATAVAFPGRPEIVAARFAASLLASVVVGLVWSRIGTDDLVRKALQNQPTPGQRRWETFVETAIHDFSHAGGYLVVGALTAASLQTIVPRRLLDSVASNGVTAVLALAVLAVVLAICSEADAFVASGLTQFSLTSRLVFLVVGPAVDVKLIALQAGTFGRRFALRFAPLTFVVCIASAVLVGNVLL